MSNHSAHERPTTMTPQERRAHLQAELQAHKQAIEALSDEELEQITGGSLPNRIHNAGTYVKGGYQAARDSGLRKASSVIMGDSGAGDALLSGGKQKISSQDARAQLRDVIKQA